jgi:hypothetical protein
MGLRKISPAFAKNEIVKVQCNNSPTSTEIPDFANQLTISRADEGTRAWRLETAATVNTGEPPVPLCEEAVVHLRGPLGTKVPA